MKYKIEVDGEKYDVEVKDEAAAGAQKTFTVDVAGKAFKIAVEQEQAAARKVPKFSVSSDKAPGPPPAMKKAAPAADTGGEVVGDAKVPAPMAGKVVAVKVAKGDEVKEGDTLFTLEAMKMENSILSPSGGTVASVSVKEGDVMKKGDVMCTIQTGG